MERREFMEFLAGVALVAAQPELASAYWQSRDSHYNNTGGVNDWVASFWTFDDGTKPAAVLDFVNNRYYDGSNLNTAIGSLVQNTTLDAGGLICNVGNINLIGSFLTALENAGGATVAIEISGGNNSAAYGVLSMSSGAPDSLFIANGPSTRMDAYNGGSIPGATVPVDFTKTAFFSVSYDNAGHVTTCDIGVVNITSNNFSTITAAQLGSYNGGFLWPGRIRTCAIYLTALATGIKSFTWPGVWQIPYRKTGLGVGTFLAANGPYIDTGTGLAAYFVNGVPWSMLAQILGNGSGDLEVIFTNVQQFGPPWYGHEAFFLTNGKIRVRIMSNWAGVPATTNLIEVDGSTNCLDGNWHTVGVTYDGSGFAAGVKMYVDGVAETLTVNFDDLTGSTDTIIGICQVGSQYGAFGMEYLNFFALSNLVRPSSYFSSVIGRTMPSADANTLVQYAFREGTGTTTADSGPNGYTGTFQTGGGGTLAWLT